MSTDLDASPVAMRAEEIRAVASSWLARFEELVNTRDPARIGEVFLPMGSWRDLLALTWDIQTFIGPEAIGDLLINRVANAHTVTLALSSRSEPRLVDAGPAGTWIEAVFEFETNVGQAWGFVRLMPVDATWLAWTASTELDDLSDGASSGTTWADVNNPDWTTASVGRPNWTDRRDPHRPFPTSSPSVLIVGGGQSGLSVAARLQRLGVDHIVIERNDQIGTSWRERHYNLITHTPSFVDHLPYLPFPRSWPISAPKDKVASWIEFYAEALDIDVWTSTELVSGAYDANEERWTVDIRRASGEIETLRPSHLVLATGLLSVPFLPQLSGTDTFKGEVMHSRDYRSGADHRGKRAIVVGSGASGHDIAQDLYEHDVEDVTLVQRSSTYVMSFVHGMPSAYGSFYDHSSDIELADLAFRSVPLPVATGISSATASHVAELDRELLEGLRSVGFEVNTNGMLATGLRSGGVSGYYINQGCSELLIQRKIALKRGSVVGFEEDRVLFADGSTLNADLVVLCTGYQNMREGARRLLGDDVADQCTEAWVPDQNRGGEHGSIWSDSGYPHLWFAAGSLHYARLYSKQLALKIAASLRGLVGTPAP